MSLFESIPNLEEIISIMEESNFDMDWRNKSLALVYPDKLPIYHRWNLESPDHITKDIPLKKQILTGINYIENLEHLKKKCDNINHTDFFKLLTEYFPEIKDAYLY